MPIEHLYRPSYQSSTTPEIVFEFIKGLCKQYFLILTHFKILIFNTKKKNINCEDTVFK